MTGGDLKEMQIEEIARGCPLCASYAALYGGTLPWPSHVVHMNGFLLGIMTERLSLHREACVTDRLCTDHLEAFMLMVEGAKMAIPEELHHVVKFRAGEPTIQ